MLRQILERTVRQHSPMKHWYLTITLRSSTTQKAINSIITAVKTSNLTTVILMNTILGLGLRKKIIYKVPQNLKSHIMQVVCFTVNYWIN